MRHVGSGNNSDAAGSSKSSRNRVRLGPMQAKPGTAGALQNHKHINSPSCTHPHTHPPSHGLHCWPLHFQLGDGSGQGQALHHLCQVGQHHDVLEGGVHQLVYHHLLDDAQGVLLVWEQLLQVVLPEVGAGPGVEQAIKCQQGGAAPLDGAGTCNALGHQVCQSCQGPGSDSLAECGRGLGFPG